METSKTILLVDDNPNFSFIWREFCEEDGHRVIVAETAQEALRLIETTPRIDLVVTDHVMPHMSGYELICRMRGLPETRETPALLLTGSAKQLRDLAEKEGAQFMNKSADTSQILRRIREALAPAAPAPVVDVTNVAPDDVVEPFQIIHTSYVDFVPRARVIPPWTPPTRPTD